MGRGLASVTLALAVVAGLAGADLARACSCAGGSLDVDGERESLFGGAKAFAGKVVAKEEVLPTDPDLGKAYRYTIRVRRSYNVRLGRTLTFEEGAVGTMCGFEWKRGEEIGGYLYGKPGKWSTGSCLLADPAALARDSRPYPRPRRGRAAMIAYGTYAGPQALALDRGGRILGYGYGRPNTKVLTADTCPGSGVVAEGHVSTTSARHAVLYTRSTSTLRPRRAARLRDEPLRVRCLSPGGTQLAAITGADAYTEYSGDRDPIRIWRVDGSRARVLRRTRAAEGSAISPTHAYTFEGRGGRALVATDLHTGAARTVLRLPFAPASVAISPDGLRLALALPSPRPEGKGRVRARVAVVTLGPGSPRLRTRELRLFSFGTVTWVSNSRFAYVSGYPAKVRLLDTKLRRASRSHRWTNGPTVAIGGRLTAVDRDNVAPTFVRRLATRGRILRRAFPSQATTAAISLAIPQWVTTTARPKTRHKPVVRKACSLPSPG